MYMELEKYLETINYNDSDKIYEYFNKIRRQYSRGLWEHKLIDYLFYDRNLDREESEIAAKLVVNEYVKASVPNSRNRLFKKVYHQNYGQFIASPRNSFAERNRSRAVLYNVLLAIDAYECRDWYARMELLDLIQVDEPCEKLEIESHDDYADDDRFCPTGYFA